MKSETWEEVVCAYGDTDLPDGLVEIFDRLDKAIKDANGMKFGEPEEYGLRSTQVIGLVVLLWKMGALQEKAGQA